MDNNGWKYIQNAPQGPDIVDLYCSSNKRRYTDCFYDPDKNMWIQRVRYLCKNGKRKTRMSQVINPTHFMYPPAPPED